MRKMLDPERAKFTLVNGITPEEYEEKMFKTFIEASIKFDMQKNNAIRKYLYERYKEAIKKVE